MLSQMSLRTLLLLVTGCIETEGPFDWANHLLEIKSLRAISVDMSTQSSISDAKDWLDLVRRRLLPWDREVKDYEVRVIALGRGFPSRRPAQPNT